MGTEGSNPSLSARARPFWGRAFYVEGYGRQGPCGLGSVDLNDLYACRAREAQAEV